MNPDQRSRWILDIEQDLSQIKDRMTALEDHFVDGGIIAELAAALHQIAVKLEALSDASG